MATDLDILKLNSNHPVGCPCYGCLHVGDKVRVYCHRHTCGGSKKDKMESFGGLGEELIVKVIDFDLDRFGIGSHPITIYWPVEGNWAISDDPDKPKEECAGYGKLIRKVGV